MTEPAHRDSTRHRLRRVAARRRANDESLGARTTAALVVVAVTAALSVLAAWNIYATPWVAVVSAVAAAVAWGIVWAGVRWRWGALTIVALFAAFAALIVPLAVPDALAAARSSGPGSLLSGLGDGIAAIALGWKQLLTLQLPVGTYQAVLVPLFVTVYSAAALETALALRSARAAPFAAFGIPFPVFFGTVFGSSVVSESLRLGDFTVPAPRELLLWVIAVAVTIVWVAWAAGIERRAALRRGRATDAAKAASTGQAAVRRNALMRGIIGAATLTAALLAAVIVTPSMAVGDRTVPRDFLDPELVARSQPSPLATYRETKRDAMLDAPLFRVSSESGALPERLRLAVLNDYDGVDFSVGNPSGSGRFTRFPSGDHVTDPSIVQVEIEAGYEDIWVPLSPPLAAPPTFSGPRASRLAESFYVNRDAGSAVDVPTAKGLREGDAFTAKMTRAQTGELDNEPFDRRPRINLENMPELSRWLEAQHLTTSAAGLTEAVQRLRDRGYLSHSLTDGEGENAWIAEASAETPIRFVSSAGGHSIARIEQLFAELTEQERTAGEQATPESLVAAIGDDEQFATAAALLARAMGYDSRIVLGVRLGEADVPGVPACTEVCTGANIAAWVEARGADGVWATLDASPQIALQPVTVEKGEQLPEFPTTPEERDANESDPPVGTTSQFNSNPNTSTSHTLSGIWPIVRIAVLSLGGLLLLALVVLFIPLVKSMRASKRRRGTDLESRALGAWYELVDAHTDSGARPRRDVARFDALDSIELVHGEIPGGDWIVTVCDQAVYAPEGVTGETVHHLWAVVDDRIASHRASLGFWRRLRARYSLASFWAALAPRARREEANARKGNRT